MRKIYLLLILPILYNNLIADEIDDIISKIQEKREVTLPKDKLLNIDSPMPKLIIVDNNISDDSNKTTVYKEKEVVLKLKGIMNNRANINGSWVKLGDKIEGYKLVDIMDDSVYLVDGNRSKMLFIEQNSSKIKIIFR